MASHPTEIEGAASEAVPLRQESAERLEIKVKHPLAIRWFHWANFPILFAMIWSGLLIYWANDVYTVFGWFPVLPMKWFDALHWDHRLAEGMGWHFFLMWLFTVNGVGYVVYLLISGEWRKIFPGRRALPEAWAVVLHDLTFRKDPPPAGKYNAAQRLAYSAILLLGAGSLVTGLAIYKPAQLFWLAAALGGYEAARFEHFWIMIAFLLFFAVHVLQVVRAGWNNFRGMVTGRELAIAEEPSDV